ncbi:mechanosensitive ion channel family protein [Anaeromyxobacter paludicola]|uniref:Mechanosensitive ion channel protein MscL n=1 Tax=Anaeromyxobacter paludicola TaxID=2918171 RepID=A0ABN6N9A2_9BACT|nr:mechanosensitive ion channel family protein [Anaeromyxobacter paludicola]BDG08473.1 mechanosensitive ion channel protein MscL [Anaeromyxobacter paludicola]
MTPTVRPWFTPHFPEPLMREGPRGLPWWQWLAIPVVLVLAAAAGRLLGFALRKLLERLSRRTHTIWDDVLLERVAGPLSALCALVSAYVLTRGLGLDDEATGAIDRLLHAATFLVLFWGALRAVEVGFQFLGQTPWSRSRPVTSSLLPIGRKVAKIAVVSLAVISFLTELGYHVESLIAGLGIGGIALALAAQKTVENLFGSVAISLDQPFRVGDYVTFEGGTSGTVESVGLRSTRVRTLERTVVTVPNGKLADLRIESVAARDRVRFYVKVPLVLGTRAAQLREVLGGVEALLRREEKLWPEGVMVRLTGLSSSSLDVEVNAWLSLSWDEFLPVRERLLVGILEVVERAGTALAYPTQTIRLGGAAAGDGRTEEERSGEGRK